MKIGVVASSITHSGGGVSEVVRGQCVALARLGVRVRVFAPSDGASIDSSFDWNGVRVSVLPAAWARFAWSPTLKQTLIDEDLDLVHLHGLWNAVSFSVLGWAKATGRPVVISPHGMLDSWAMKRSKMKKWLAWSLFERRNTRGASCFHALNSQEALSIRARGVSAPIIVLPNGVDLPILNCRASNFDERRRVLLFLGRLHPKKGLLEMLQAWVELKKIYPEIAKAWKIDIAGWGDDNYVSQLHNFVAANRLQTDVSLIGPVFGQEKDRAFRGANAFVLASHSEGLPMAVLEAWSYGLPVLMTEACNLAVGFKAGAACQISTDPIELSRTFAEVLGNTEQLELMGARGRQLVAESFSWESVAQGLYRTFESLIEDRSLVVAQEL